VPSAGVTISSTGLVTAPAGTYTITSSANGCTSAASASVTINAQPSYQIVIINSSDANCNSDIDLKFDLDTYLPADIPSTGIWIDADQSNGLVGDSEFSPYLIDVGTYTFTYQIIDIGGCPREVELNMTIDDDCIVLPACSGLNEQDVHNAFSPNGDNTNEIFVIDGINQFECFPTNTVEIYNRWGVLVYETRQYDNDTRVFTGTSEGRVTVDKSSLLPTGTYFYVINYTDTDGDNHHLEGYLYLAR
jgi:gliding motility-associated-like protein